MIPDLLLVAVDFYKDPRRFPHFREGTGPLPPGITELLDGASALLAEGRREEVSATLGVSPEELEAALRFFVKEVMLRAGDHPARILGVPADADLALIKKHYRHLMSLFHPDKDTAGEGWDALYAPKITEAYSMLRKQAGRAGETQDPEHTSSTGASQAPMQSSTRAASEDDLSPWGTEAAGQGSPSPGDRMSPQVPNSPQPQPIFSDGPDRQVMAGLVRLGLMRLANVPRVAVYSGVGSLMLLVALGLWIVKPSTPELTLAGGAPSAPTTTGTVKLDVAERGAMGSGAGAMQSGNAMAAATTKPLTGDALKARVEERVLAAAASADQSTPIVQQGPAAATEATLSADQPAKDSHLRAAAAALAATSTPSMTPEPAPVEEPAPVVAVAALETPAPEPEPIPEPEPVVAVATVEPASVGEPSSMVDSGPLDDPAFKIQELVARIQQAYEQEDAKAFAALFTDEGDATDVTGREAIYAYYEEYFSRTNIDRFRLVFMTWEAQGEGVFAIDSNVEIWIRPKDDRPEVRTKIPITWKVAALEQSYFVDRMEY